jgi:hypothetical protein
MGNGGEESECVEERTGEKTGGNDGLGHLVPLLLFFGDANSKVFLQYLDTVTYIRSIIILYVSNFQLCFSELLSFSSFFMSLKKKWR